jgi:hypothetical protein
LTPSLVALPPSLGKRHAALDNMLGFLEATKNVTLPSKRTEIEAIKQELLYFTAIVNELKVGKTLKP